MRALRRPGGGKGFAGREPFVRRGSIGDRGEGTMFSKQDGVKFFRGGKQSLGKEWKIHNDLPPMISVKLLGLRKGQPQSYRLIKGKWELL